MSTNPQVTNTTHFFKSADETRKIFYQRYESIHNDTKGSLVVTHGLGEHSDAYHSFCKEISASLPLNVIAWDLHGHGNSSGQRGYVGDISWFEQDLMQLLNIVQEADKKPIYLLSHSLGGLVTLYTQQNNPNFDKLKINGIILSNPCTKLNFTPPKWKRLGADVLTKLAPKVTLGNEISPNQLSSDETYLKAHKADPLKHSRISPRLFLGMLQLMEGITTPTESKTPTLCLLSPKDSVCDASNTARLLKASAELIFFEKSMHEVLNDIEKGTAISKIKEFLSANL